MVQNGDLQEFKYLYKEVVENGYEFGTGIWVAINDNFEMRLNESGEYHTYLKKEIGEINYKDLSVLKQTCLSLSDKNESDVSKELFSEIDGIRYDKDIGYYSGLYVGHVVEGDFRNNGSSGGFGTWIFKELLENNYIDGVIHVKESRDSDKLFEYGISTTIEEIISGSKTKYYPVEYSDVIKTIQKTPGRYAIIGLPSYIMEIRLLADLNPIIKERIKFAIGLVCGHQKSSKFAEYLAWQCGIKPGNLKSINFRKKMDSEPSSSYAIEVSGIIDGEERTIIKQMSELDGADWGKGYFKVRASDFTDDVMNETADITLGDAWLPEYTVDSKGNNILVVRNPIIKDIIEDGVRSGKVKVDVVDVKTIYRSQSSHYKHTVDELGYRLYKKDKKNIWRPKKRIEPSKKISFIRRMIQDKREQINIEIPKAYKESVARDNIEIILKKSKKLSNQYRNLYRLKRLMSKFR